MQKYVLKGDPREPSPDNFWGTEAAKSPEEASQRFRERIQAAYPPSKTASAYMIHREDDRVRRIRNGDFDVELL